MKTFIHNSLIGAFGGSALGSSFGTSGSTVGAILGMLLMIAAQLYSGHKRASSRRSV